MNLIPKNFEEYEAGVRLVAQWTVDAGNNGEAFCENGIGKLKKHLLTLAGGAESVKAMRALKKLFDPNALLNRGTVFDER